jgi:hypothetical protein
MQDWSKLGATLGFTLLRLIRSIYFNNLDSQLIADAQLAVRPLYALLRWGDKLAEGESAYLARLPGARDPVYCDV